MKRIGRFLFYGALFLIALILLAPKVNLYYLAEEQLEPRGIIIDGETLTDRTFSLEISGATLYAQQIESGSAEHITINLLGLYNRITVEEMALSKTLAKFWPAAVSKAEMTHAFWDPLHLNIAAEGDFGTLKAVVSLADRTLTARLEPSQLMRRRFGATLRQLKKDDTGGYRYESRF
jgi:hypothetical protein